LLGILRVTLCLRGPQARRVECVFHTAEAVLVFIHRSDKRKEMAQVLITGATGFIGHHLLAELAHHHLVFAVTRNAPPKNEGQAIWLQADLSRPDATIGFPNKMDIVIHLAQARGYRDFPAQATDIFNINANATLMLLEYARRSDAHTIVFASTANVYRRSQTLLTEDAPIEPLTFYALSKRIAEMLIESYAEFFRCIVLRLFTVYGPGQTGMLIPLLIERVQQGQPIQVQGQQGLMLTPTYVADLNAVVMAMLESAPDSPGYDVFNVGGSQAFGIHELGVIIGQVLGLPPRFDFTGGDEPGGWMADNSRLKMRWSRKAFTPIEKGLELFLSKRVTMVAGKD